MGYRPLARTPHRVCHGAEKGREMFGLSRLGRRGLTWRYVGTSRTARQGGHAAGVKPRRGSRGLEKHERRQARRIVVILGPLQTPGDKEQSPVSLNTAGFQRRPIDERPLQQAQICTRAGSSAARRASLITLASWLLRGDGGNDAMGFEPPGCRRRLHLPRA
jgi:hypothetical protein